MPMPRFPLVTGLCLFIACGSSGPSPSALAGRPAADAGGAEFAVLETRQPLNPPGRAANASDGLLFFPQPSGYQSASAGSTGFSTYSDTGARLAFDPIVGGSGAPDPAGGTVMTFYQPQGG